MKRQVMILSLIKDNNHGLKNIYNLASSLESQYSYFKYQLMPRNAIYAAQTTIHNGTYFFI